MAEPFDLDAFMADLENDSQKPRSAEDRLNRVLMNIRDNQGTLEMLPFLSKKIGNIYTKIEKVREFKGYTSVIDKEDPVWYKILPLSSYGKLTSEQLELYSEVSGLYDALFETEELERDEIRLRNYSMFFGVALKLTNTDGNEVEDFLGVPALFLYPSLNVVDALNSAIASKKKALGDKIKPFLQDIITPTLSGRKGIIQIDYKRANIGYDAKVSLERNTEFRTFIDPDKKFTPEFASQFDDPIAGFLGWMYDRENKSYFHETAFRELKKNLEIRLKEVTGQSQEDEPTPENKNGYVDPMKDQRPPVPGADDASLRPKRPF